MLFKKKQTHETKRKKKLLGKAHQQITNHKWMSGVENKVEEMNHSGKKNHVST